MGMEPGQGRRKEKGQRKRAGARAAHAALARGCHARRARPRAMASCGAGASHGICP